METSNRGITCCWTVLPDVVVLKPFHGMDPPLNRVSHGHLPSHGQQVLKAPPTLCPKALPSSPCLPKPAGPQLQLMAWSLGLRPAARGWGGRGGSGQPAALGGLGVRPASVAGAGLLWPQRGEEREKGEECSELQRAEGWSLGWKGQDQC